MAVGEWGKDWKGGISKECEETIQNDYFVYRVDGSMVYMHTYIKLYEIVFNMHIYRMPLISQKSC